MYCRNFWKHIQNYNVHTHAHTGVHVHEYVATSPGNDVILSSYIFY